MLREVGEEYEGEEEATETDNNLNGIPTQMENRYQLQQEVKRNFHNEELDNSSDYEYNNCFKNISSNDNSDDEFDRDEIQVDGLVGKLKSKRVKELEAQLTRDQLEEEKR